MGRPTLYIYRQGFIPSGLPPAMVGQCVTAFISLAVSKIRKSNLFECNAYYYVMLMFKQNVETDSLVGCRTVVLLSPMAISQVLMSSQIWSSEVYKNAYYYRLCYAPTLESYCELITVLNMTTVLQTTPWMETEMAIIVWLLNLI